MSDSQGSAASSAAQAAAAAAATKRSLEETVAMHPPKKRMKLRIQEPDVTVVVGNQSFQHYSVVLCAASPYMDAMLSCETMKEAQERIVRFPDKDPEEWEKVARLLEPCTTETFTVKDIPMLLPWFHELQIDGLVSKCEELIKEDVKRTVSVQSKKPVSDFLLLLELSDKYDLRSAKQACLVSAEAWIKRGNIILGSNGVRRLVPFLRERDSLWNALIKFLPNEYKNENRENLMTNPLFAYMVSARWRLRWERKKGRRLQAAAAAAVAARDAEQPRVRIVRRGVPARARVAGAAAAPPAAVGPVVAVQQLQRAFRAQQLRAQGRPAQARRIPAAAPEVVFRLEAPAEAAPAEAAAPRRVRLRREEIDEDADDGDLQPPNRAGVIDLAPHHHDDDDDDEAAADGDGEF